MVDSVVLYGLWSTERVDLRRRVLGSAGDREGEVDVGNEGGDCPLPWTRVFTTSRGKVASQPAVNVQR